jgi:hypothetical protein
MATVDGRWLAATGGIRAVDCVSLCPGEKQVDRVLDEPGIRPVAVSRCAGTPTHLVALTQLPQFGGLTGFFLGGPRRPAPDTHGVEVARSSKVLGEAAASAGRWGPIEVSTTCVVPTYRVVRAPRGVRSRDAESTTRVPAALDGSEGW